MARQLAANEDYVAPFTGAWIEMPTASAFSSQLTVAPFTGAWIEIRMRPWTPAMWGGRSLHGSVD